MLVFMIIYFTIFPMTLSRNEEKIAKVICSLSRYTDVDISKEVFGDAFKLSKSLKEQCYVRLRYVSPNVISIGKTNIVLFASHEMKLKENLWPP